MIYMMASTYRKFEISVSFICDGEVGRKKNSSEQKIFFRLHGKNRLLALI